MDNNLTFLNACRNGQKSIVRIFLDKGGVNLDKRDGEGNTPLYYACRQGHRDVVALLLDRGADVSLITIVVKAPCMLRHRVGTRRLWPCWPGMEPT